MKEFIKELKIKKMKASEIAYEIVSYQTDLVRWFINDAHKAKNAELVNELYSKMATEKFAKAMKKILKNKDDMYGELDCGFAVIIASFLEKFHKDESVTDEIIEIYTDVTDKLLKKRIKEVNKKLNISEDVIKELLVITPDVGYISNDKFVGIYSQKMLRKLYILSAENEIGLTETEQVQKLFKKLFGKNLLDLIAINILLEKKEYLKNFNEQQTAMWNLMTSFALEYIEGEEKEHIVELLEYYCSRRKRDAENNKDGARRINLSSVPESDYPRIAKGIKKFTKNGKESLVKYL
jgi:hypothetical protein